MDDGGTALAALIDMGQAIKHLFSNIEVLSPNKDQKIINNKYTSLLTGSVSLGVILGIMITPITIQVHRNCVCYFVCLLDTLATVLQIKDNGKGK